MERMEPKSWVFLNNEGSGGEELVELEEKIWIHVASN